MSASNPDDVGDPIDYFVEDKELLGNDRETIRQYRTVLGDFSEFLQGEGLEPGDATRRDCMAWIDSLRDPDRDLASSTIASYASTLHSFYNYMSNRGIFEANPMADVLRQMNESISKNPTRRDLTVDEMAEFVRQVHQPATKAMIMLWVKTGMRNGELINLDIRDIHIDDPEVKREYPEVRTEIEDKPDTLFVEGNIATGDVVHGEERRFANKRKRDTVVPLDDELKVVLSRWLAARPDSAVSSPADPLFTSVMHIWGERVSRSTVKEWVRKETEPYGWWSKDEGPSTNVTPHYFRHFFTTHMRARSGDDVMVKYLRGDVGDDILDTYTHNWGNMVEETYLDSIYKLL